MDGVAERGRVLGGASPVQVGPGGLSENLRHAPRNRRDGPSPGSRFWVSEKNETARPNSRAW